MSDLSIADDEIIVAKPRAQLSPGLRSLLLLALPVLFLGVFFGYPMADIIARSFHAADGALTLQNYVTLADRPAYWRVMMITLQLSLAVTVICILVGYPLAYVAANSRPLVAGIMMAFVVLPFLTSVLVRNYGWIVLLRPGGILADVASAIAGREVPLLYNRFGVLVGLVYTMLPYFVLTLYSVLKAIDTRLIFVAYSLGSSKWSAFRRIYLPLSMPGIVGGALLVFILTTGFFITPRLLGGDRDQMLSSIIAYQIEIVVDWNMASSLAVVLLAISLVLFLVYARLVGIKQLVTSKW